jgi:hypothetical protein
MVERKAKQGKFVGKPFSGCQQYSKCSGIVRICLGPFYEEEGLQEGFAEQRAAQIATRTWQRIRRLFSQESGRRVRVAPLTRRCRASAGTARTARADEEHPVTKTRAMRVREGTKDTQNKRRADLPKNAQHCGKSPARRRRTSLVPWVSAPGPMRSGEDDYHQRTQVTLKDLAADVTAALGWRGRCPIARERIEWKMVGRISIH